MKKGSVKFNTGFTTIVDFDDVSTSLKRSSRTSSKFTTGFTLIELLVVVAIIGILSGVVIASLNGAREKSKIATIKSTLKQLYNQASLNQLEFGSFIGSNDNGLNCTGPNNNLLKIAQTLIDKGVVVKCNSFYGTTYATSPDPYDGDDYQRFGATALIYDTGELKAWSVDENGVVKWDTHGVNTDGTTRSTDTTMEWKTTGGVIVAADACAKNGGRLPSIEQLRTLTHAWYQGSSNTAIIPLGFSAINYWSSTPVPSSPSSVFYTLFISGGISYFYGNNQTSPNYVRCVR